MYAQCSVTCRNKFLHNVHTVRPNN